MAYFQTLHNPYLSNTKALALTFSRQHKRVMPSSQTRVVIPIGDNEQPTFRLDRLAPANGYDDVQCA